MDPNELPKPVTATELYLAAILDEVRRLNAASSSVQGAETRVKEPAKSKR